LKAQNSTFSAAEQRLFNQIEELRNQRHVEKNQFYDQIEHYKKILAMRQTAKKNAQNANSLIWRQ
jgi:uncharacterized protein (UPF0305 family)